MTVSRTLSKAIVPAVGLLALAGTAAADLKLSVTVTGSGEPASVLPLSGKYEVDFHAGYARVIQPNGQIQLYDFGHAQVFTLDPTTKTYTTQSLPSTLVPSTGVGKAAHFTRDTATRQTKMLGAPATHFLIEDQSSMTPSTGPTGYGRRRTGGSGPRGGSIGSAWLEDASTVKSSLTSVAPLVAIGAPKLFAASITQQIDAAPGVPVSMSFSWNSAIGSGSMTMQVASVTNAPLNAALFGVPKEYRPAAAGGAK
jgi:hypothetical protein